MSRLTLVSPSLDFTIGRWKDGAGRPMSSPGLEASVLSSMNVIAARDWDALFPDGSSSYDLHRAFEAVPRSGYLLGCVVVHARGNLIAAAPLFQTAQPGDSRANGRLHPIPVLGLGSPMTDRSSIGIANHLDTRMRGLAISALIGALNREAKRRRSLIVSIKGVDAAAGELHAILQKTGFGRVAGVPSAGLALRFPSFDAYLANLPAGQQRKLRRASCDTADLRFEYRRSTAGIASQLMALCRNSEMGDGSHDDLHPGYFTEMLSRLGHGCNLLLAWKDEELAGFQLFMTGAGRLVADKSGVATGGPGDNRLRLALRLKMIAHAIENSIPEADLGPLEPADALTLGAVLERRWLYFRFTSGVINQFARPLRRLLDTERNDPIAKVLALTRG